ncbi:MAG: biosynthetic-type acetolactate synthase large subunit [Bacteroidales bacterium]|nr:biosynthetic-type acetolactate synthase large subunit [Bacteroidales bacterium]
MEAQKKIKGSEAVVRALLAEGVETIFGYPGGAAMPLYDTLFDYEDKIKHVLVRHEQAASHAAQAYSQVTDKVGVCISTSGPGATNLITGIANANIDSVPMVVITCQVISPLLGTDAFQETDMVGLSMPITKWNYQVTKPEEIAEALAKAFYIAVSGRPGVVLIDITKDALLAETEEFEYLRSPRIRSYNPYPEIIESQINEAAELINQAKKPLLLVGHGILIARAEKELAEFAEKANIPVASTLLGLSAFPSGHELFAGMLGMHGNYAPNKLTNQADVIIAVGMRFDDRVTGRLSDYAKQAKIIHIEIDPAEINKNVTVDLAINADVKAVLNLLVPKIEKQTHPEWHKQFKDLYDQEYETVIQHDCWPKSDKIKMGEVVHLISEKTKGDAIIVTDVGQHQMVAARYYKYSNPNSLITSGGLGTMGFGLPAAMGAAMAVPGKQVVLFVGDGGLQMTIQEFGTIMQENIPVKIVVLNNSFLGMVRQWQDMFFEKRYAETNMVNPDFVKVAEGYRIKGRLVDSRVDLSAALDEMLASKEAYLLEVSVEKETNVFPMIAPGASVDEIRIA